MAGQLPSTGLGSVSRVRERPRKERQTRILLGIQASPSYGQGAEMPKWYWELP